MTSTSHWADDNDNSSDEESDEIEEEEVPITSTTENRNQGNLRPIPNKMIPSGPPYVV